jgi:hypothetical protein
MKTPLFVILVVATLAFLTVAVRCQSNPLPLGTVIDNGSMFCPAGFQKNAACESLTISCPNLPDLNVTSAIVAGTLGIVELANGSGWTIPGMSGYATTLAAAGFQTNTAAWASPWEEGADNILEAACRPATLMNYWAGNQKVFVIAASGGSGALAYCISWYGCSSFIAGGGISSGPVFSDIGLGCETPPPAQQWIVPNDGTAWYGPLNYGNGVPTQMTTDTGQPCRPKQNTTSQEYAIWEAQSILAAGAEFPYVPIYAQLCQTAKEVNNSAAQGYLWLKPMNAWIVAINNCSGEEGTQTGTTPEGINGAAAMVSYVEANF